MLGIVLINYKCHGETIAYVRQELVKTKATYQIAIVDNSCDEKELDALQQEFAQDSFVDILNPKDNLGYARANNFGARHLLQNCDIDYILFSNSDIEFKENDVVDYLLNKMKKDNIIHIGPQVLDAKEFYPISPNEYESFYHRYLFDILFWANMEFILGNIKGKILKTRSIENTSTHFFAPSGVYYKLSGCFVILNARVFEEIGMYDENTFLMGEEMILSERLLAHGYNSYFDNERTVFHRGSETVSRVYSTIKKVWYLTAEAEKYYYHHYKKVPSWLLACIPFCIETHFFVRKILLFVRQSISQVLKKMKKS